MSSPDATPRKLEFHYVLACPCGQVLTGDTEDEIVDTSLAHLREKHPDMEYEREHVLFMAQRLLKPAPAPAED